MSNIKSEIGIVLVVAVTAIAFTALVASSVSPGQEQMEIHLVLQTIHQRCRQVVVVLIMPQVGCKQDRIYVKVSYATMEKAYEHNIDV